jgi:hypothetical protein
VLCEATNARNFKGEECEAGFCACREVTLKQDPFTAFFLVIVIFGVVQLRIGPVIGQ